MKKLSVVFYPSVSRLQEMRLIWGVALQKRKILKSNPNLESGDRVERRTREYPFNSRSCCRKGVPGPFFFKKKRKKPIGGPEEATGETKGRISNSKKSTFEMKRLHNKTHPLSFLFCELKFFFYFFFLFSDYYYVHDNKLL